MVPMSNQNQSEKAAVQFQEQVATVKTHKKVIRPSARPSDHCKDPQEGHQATVKNEFGNIKTHRKVSFSTARFLDSIDFPAPSATSSPVPATRTTRRRPRISIPTYSSYHSYLCYALVQISGFDVM